MGGGKQEPPGLRAGGLREDSRGKQPGLSPPVREALGAGVSRRLGLAPPSTLTGGLAWGGGLLGSPAAPSPGDLTSWHEPSPEEARDCWLGLPSDPGPPQATGIGHEELLTRTGQAPDSRSGSALLDRAGARTALRTFTPGARPRPPPRARAPRCALWGRGDAP